MWRKKSRQWGAIRGVRRVPHPPRHRSRRSGVRRFGAYTRGTLGAARVLPSSGRGVRGTKREGEGSVKSVTALVTSLVCLIHPGKFRAPLRSSSRSRTFVWSIRAGAVRPGCRLSPARLPRFPPGVPVFAVPSRPEPSPARDTSPFRCRGRDSHPQPGGRPGNTTDMGHPARRRFPVVAAGGYLNETWAALCRVLSSTRQPRTTTKIGHRSLPPDFDR